MTVPIRVVIVEDMPDDAELMVLRLSEEGVLVDWQRVDNEPDYLAALTPPPDLILADWSLPKFSGLRALQLLRERSLDIHFIIVSGSIGEEAAVDAMRQRAYDCVLKDRPERLGQVVLHALEDKRLRDERKQAEEAQRKREKEAHRLAEENALMAEIGRIISSTLNIDEVYSLFSAKVKILLPYDRIVITLISKDGTTLINRYVEGDSAPERNAGDNFPMTRTLTEAMIQNRAGAMIDSQGEDEIAERYPGLLPEFKAGFRSFLSVPLISRDKPIGGLHFRSKRFRFYSGKDLELAESIANQIAGAVANAQLFTEHKQVEEALQMSEAQANQLAQENAIMAEIGRIVSSTLHIDEVYERFATEARKLISFDRIVISIIDLEKMTGISTYIAGRGVSDRCTGVRYPLEGTGIAEMIRAQASVLVQSENIQELRDRFPMLVSTFQAGFRSIMNVPLYAKGQIIGGFLLRSVQSNAYSIKDLKLAERIGGQIAGAIANSQLYIGLRKTEEALRESEKKYRTLVTQSPDGIFIVDLQGTFLAVNKAMCERLKYGEEEFLSMKIWDIVPEKYLELHKKRLSDILRGETPNEAAEYEVRGKDEKMHYVEVLSTPYFRENEVVGFQGIARDITERKHAEVALKETNETLGTIIRSSPLAIIALDPDGNVTRWNQAAEQMFGFRESEVLGQFLPIVSEDKRDEHLKLRERVLQGEAFTNVEVRRRKKDGSPVDISISIAPLRDSQGRVIGIMSVSADITERKRAEQETASLQDQLRQSQKVEAIGQLAGGIAHDFNNLLTIIQGNSQFSLMDLQEGDPLRANIEEVREAAKRAADLTRQLLAFSRKQILEMRVLDLNQVLQRLDKMLRRVIGEDIELTMFLPELIWKVKADAGQIEQVIMNISVNARDAMPEGGKLTIETANVELDKEYAKRHIAVQPGRYVMLSISDTGVGMTPEVREKIFEPFFTTKEKGKGTGLGLSTVYGIVKQSGGNIWVYSEPGLGTTFKIYLPQVNEPLEEQREEVVKEVSGGHETILIAEDEDVVRKLAARILKRQGFKVLEAPDGGKALMLCEAYKEPIHLILTDVVMPGMSGRKLVDRLKVIHPEIKVLYMSGYTDNAILHHGILEPGTNFIQKPFTVETLPRKVREVLDK